MKLKEPEFMRELHRIRAKISRKWEKMSDTELVSHLHKIGKEFKQSLRSQKSTVLHSK
jgi:hypothetical protein